MGKLASLLAVTFVAGLMQSPADAAGRWRGCPCACGGGGVMTTAAAPVPAPAPAVAQSPAAGATQSFSQEPAPPAPVMAAPRMVYTTVRARPVYEPGRADNKARGVYNR